MGGDGGGDVPVQVGEPLCDSDVVSVLRVFFVATAVLKAAAKPPFALLVRGSTGGGGGVVGAAGVPGAGLAWATLMDSLGGVCIFFVSAIGLVSFDRGGTGCGIDRGRKVGATGLSGVVVPSLEPAVSSVETVFRVCKCSLSFFISWVSWWIWY